MIVWLIWFATSFAAFLVFETRAILTGNPTLSRTVWKLGREAPLSAAAFGLIIGGLIVHFYAGPETCGP